MACLLVLVLAATVLTAPPGKHLTLAARTTSPEEAFWRAALPDAPMPESIRELLRRPSAEVNAPDADVVNVHGDDPPPMNFNYDDYRASPAARDLQAAAAVSSAKALEHGAGAWDDASSSSPAVFFLEDAVRVGGSLPFLRSLPPADHQPPPLELYTVRAVRAVEGSSFVVCRREAAGSGGGDAVYGCRGVVVGPATARAYVVDVVGERGDAVTTAVVCHTDTSSNRNLGLDAFRLLDVKPGGAAVCYAVPDAQMLPVKSEKGYTDHLLVL